MRCSEQLFGHAELWAFAMLPTTTTLMARRRLLGQIEILALQFGGERSVITNLNYQFVCAQTRIRDLTFQEALREDRMTHTCRLTLLLTTILRQKQAD